MVQSTAEVLEERGTRYGVFGMQAQIAQSIHLILDEGMRQTGKTKFSFAPDQLEAVNMIVNKLARIYNGDPHYADSWRDIAGYATLVADRIDNDNLKEQKFIAEQAEAKEQYERNRNPEEAQVDRGCDEGCELCVQPTTSPEPGSDNRPTGQPELRRLPVKIEVQDGNHAPISPQV